MKRIFDHPYRVVRWSSDGEMVEEVAQALTFSIAEAAWTAALAAWPEHEITLQNGVRVMKKGQGVSVT